MKVMDDKVLQTKLLKEVQDDPAGLSLKIRVTNRKLEIMR